jgi:hypothetical protein
MKLIVIVEESKPGELIKLGSAILGAADVIIENGSIVKAASFSGGEWVRKSDVKEMK